MRNDPNRSSFQASITPETPTKTLTNLHYEDIINSFQIKNVPENNDQNPSSHLDGKMSQEENR